ncbi:MAG: glycosyltransferase family 4 protein [Clostridiales bacterium]|nr:glycosyltransferase family 4 protein [Clostridiales bacterium]
MKKMLIIAYFFEPFKGVGTKRVSYWAQNINDISKGEIVCDVLTATDPEKAEFHGINNLYYVPNTHKKTILGSMIKDEGLSWVTDIEKFCNENKIFNYDYVLISGGPFMHFSIAGYFKRKYNSKVILDFRDPFANNPRFVNNKIKNSIKSYFENKFIKNCDKYITVNKYCKELVGNERDKERAYIIDNGYDENIIDKINKSSKAKNTKLNIVYTGTVYSDFNINNFLNVLREKEINEKVIFNYAGNNNEIKDNYNIKNHGQLEYSKSLELMNNNDVGIIFTGGKPFESTTKIFEYIGCDKIIMIITDGEPKTGNIHEITKDLESVFWCKNNKEDIRNTINELLENNIQVNRKNKEKYSRRVGTQKLLQLFRELDNKCN